MNRLAVVTAAAFLATVGCTHLPFAGMPAIAGPAPNSQRAPACAAPAFPLPAFPGWGFRVCGEGSDASSTLRHERFTLMTYDDAAGGYLIVAGEIYLPAEAQPDRRLPLVAASPILGGVQADYFDCRVFGRWAAAHGYASFFLYQDENLLRPDADAVALERRLEAWVESMRRALDAILERFPIDPQRLGTFGISLGGIRTVLLAAREPRFRANVICLAGAGLSEIVANSKEAMVERYLARRCEVLLAPPEVIVADWKANLRADPLHVARQIAPESVLLFLGGIDDKVPVATGWRLFEALGCPETRVSPLGHYSSLLLLPWATRHSFSFYARRFSDAQANGEAAQPPIEPEGE